MRALDYAFRQGWRSLWRARTSTLFAIVAIALALIVLGTLLLVTWNVQRALARVSTAAEPGGHRVDPARGARRPARPRHPPRGAPPLPVRSAPLLVPVVAPVTVGLPRRAADGDPWWQSSDLADMSSSWHARQNR